MFKILRKSLGSPRQTVAYPDRPAHAPEGFRGAPELKEELCDGCGLCSSVCPTGAIDVSGRSVAVRQTNCIFCGLCQEACPKGAVQLGSRYELAALSEHLAAVPGHQEAVGKVLQDRIGRLFGRSLHIRHVDSGSCNGCDFEMTALTNAFYDVQRFGIDFVASPRHADMLLVTGPVTRHLEVALRRTYQAAAEPRLVVALGACACGGGIFGGSYATLGGVDRVVPVDAYIPGCPPRPLAIIHGLLLALGRWPAEALIR